MRRLPDIDWFTPDGKSMTENDWGSGFGRSIAVYLNGQGIPDRDSRGERVVDDSFVMCFNAHHEAIEFTVPPAEYSPAWQLVLDTDRAELPDLEPYKADATIRVQARGLVVLQSIS
jgi:glycogen operon protein